MSKTASTLRYLGRRVRHLSDHRHDPEAFASAQKEIVAELHRLAGLIERNRHA